MIKTENILWAKCCLDEQGDSRNKQNEGIQDRDWLH